MFFKFIRREVPELKVSLKVHSIMMMLKNALVFILIQPAKKENIKTVLFINYHALRVMLINLAILFGFLSSLLKQNITLYKYTLYGCLILYLFSALLCIGLLILFITLKIKIYWFFVVLVFLCSVIEFIFAFSQIKSLKVVSVKNVMRMTNDENIINAYHARSIMSSTKLGIALLNITLIYDLLWEKAFHLGDYDVTKKPKIMSFIFKMILNIFIITINTLTFILITVKIEMEYIWQRYVALTLQFINFTVSLIIYTLYIIKTFTVGGFFLHFGYIANFVFVGYTILAIYNEMKWLNKGLKEVLLFNCMPFVKKNKL